MTELSYSVSLTTRKPRQGEADGVDYHFVSRDEFEEKIDSGLIIEHAFIFGNYYGTSLNCVQEALENKKELLLDTDVDGASRLKMLFPEGLFVLLLPPSREELKNRLKKRNTEDENQINVRLKRVNYELKTATGYTHLVVNDDLEETVNNIKSIIIADRFRTNRSIAKLKKQLEF